MSQTDRENHKALKRKRRKVERAGKRLGLQQRAEERERARMVVANETLSKAITGLVNKVMKAAGVDEANAKMLLAIQLSQQDILSAAKPKNNGNVRTTSDVLPSEGDIMAEPSPATFNRAVWGQPVKEQR
jgi:hypothetical protein